MTDMRYGDLQPGQVYMKPDDPCVYRVLPKAVDGHTDVEVLKWTSPDADEIVAKFKAKGWTDKDIKAALDAGQARSTLVVIAR